VKDNVGTDGTKNLVVQTKIQFSDMTVSLLAGDKSKLISPSNLKSLVELYIAFFNRLPDAEGMIYWSEQIAAGVSIEQLSNNFYSAAIDPQYSKLTGYSATMSNDEFVHVIYKNVLGRNEVDQEGLDYWTASLANGSKTRGNLISTIIDAAHGFKGDATFGWVADLLDNKVNVGMYFAIQQGLNFNTEEDSITKGMSIAALITPTDIIAAKAAIGVNDPAFDLTSTVPNSPEFDKVVAVVNAKCIQCHGPVRMEAAVALYTNSLIRLNGQAMYLAVVVTKSMPKEGTLTADERNAIATRYLNGMK
jgi:hypothetical protein